MEMRVLHISSAVNFGGGERHLADLCGGLRERGHEVFTALRPANIWRAELVSLPEENILYSPLRNSLDVSSARQIARFVRENKIEIIHAHLARDYPVAALAARRSKTRLVLTRHLTFPLGFLHKIILPKDAAFIAVSESVRRALAAQNILPRAQIRRIYNGVRTHLFADAEKKLNKQNLIQYLKLNDDAPLIGIVGEIAAHKGQADFARAAAEILKRFPGAEFLIAGRDASPAKKHENDLKFLIEELGIKRKVHFFGWLEDVAAFLSALDVFASASHFESFGLATVEALAAGCAVAATATDGALETIEDGKTGRLVPVQNPRALAAAICEILSDEKLRRNLSANAARAVAKNFSVERMVIKTEELYRELVETRAK